jgi:hypothetical protein
MPDIEAASFFLQDTESALIHQVQWVQKHARLSDQFFLNVLDVDERTFFHWRTGDEEFPEDLQERLKEVWEMTRHILSFVDFESELLRMMFEEPLETKAGPTISPFTPPWLGTSLKAYLEASGMAGIRAVNRWVQTMRFGNYS